MIAIFLDSPDSIGFCTLIEATKSRLFSNGCVQTSEPVKDDDKFQFEVHVPALGTEAALKMLQVIGEVGGEVPWHLRHGAPIFVQFQREHAPLASSSQQQAKFASDLINRFLRAYEHTYFDLTVPRHRLDGRAVVMVASDGCVSLEYTPVIVDLDDVLMDYLPPHTDVESENLRALMGTPELITPSWRILIDGVRHFESANLREAILCACSAVEIVASPGVERWLREMTLTGEDDSLEKAVREMGNPLRFNLCIATIYKDAFAELSPEEKQRLLNQLRALNRVRNRVVHAGDEPDPGATAEALQAAAMFVCKVWLNSLGLR